MSRKKGSKVGLVYGWGVVDVDYRVGKYEIVDGKRHCVWICPYYVKWKSIIARCFCPKIKTKRPNYKDCTITEEWKYLSNFIKWVDSQPNKDWENCHPDKDILFRGNKHYSPETVVFVSGVVNGFILSSGKSRGELMVGVSFVPNESKNKPYRAQCSINGKQRNLGRYATEIDAHLAWQACKHELACKLAEEQTDPRVAKVLRERYAPDKDWTKE